MSKRKKRKKRSTCRFHKGKVQFRGEGGEICALSNSSRMWLFIAGWQVTWNLQNIVWLIAYSARKNKTILTATFSNIYVRVCVYKLCLVSKGLGFRSLYELISFSSATSSHNATRSSVVAHFDPAILKQNLLLVFWQALSPQTRSQDTYSSVNRMG